MDQNLQSIKNQIDSWRATRIRGTRIPEQFWRSALVLTKSHKPTKVCRVLGLDHGTMRKRLQTSSKFKSSTAEETTIVRVAPVKVASMAAGSSRSFKSTLLAELSIPSGIQLRVFSGIDAEGVKALGQLLREVQ